MYNTFHVILFLCFLVANVIAQQEALVVKVAENNRIMKFDFATESAKQIYQSDKYAIHDVKVSPNNQYVGVMESSEGKVSGRKYSVLPQNTLVILNEKGQKIHSIDKDVHEFVWSPDGKKIAFITGTYHEGGIGYIPNGLYLWNITTNEIKQISGISYPYRLHWSEKEKAIYIKNLYPRNGKIVFKYQVDSGELIPTDYKDVYFSPDGEYYLDLPDEGDPEVRLYEARTNNEVSSQLKRDLGNPSGWLPDTGHYLLYQKEDIKIKTLGEGPVKVEKQRKVEEAEHIIYDVKKRKVTKKLDRGLIGDWKGSEAFLLIEQEGKIIAEKAAKVLKEQR